MTCPRNYIFPLVIFGWNHFFYSNLQLNANLLFLSVTDLPVTYVIKLLLFLPSKKLLSSFLVRTQSSCRLALRRQQFLTNYSPQSRMLGELLLLSLAVFCFLSSFFWSLKKTKKNCLVLGC